MTAPEPPDLVERFAKFNDDNPHVYKILVRLAREWVRRTGRRKLGIAMLWERMRWELAVETNETPVLDNSYRAFMARLIMQREEDLADIFETRRSVADRPQGCRATGGCRPGARCAEHKDADPVILGDLLGEHAPQRPECRPDIRSRKRKPTDRS